MCAGLVFDSLPEGAASTEQRLALLFFMLLLYQLMPFCFMSFYVADRRFFQADVAADLYAPSAYYLAAVSASAFLRLLLSDPAAWKHHKEEGKGRTPERSAGHLRPPVNQSA